MTEIRVVAGPALLAPCLEVRFKVFVEEQGIDPAVERDEYDETAVHALALAEGRPLAAGRLIHRQGQWQIGRVAVLAEQRGSGLGRLVMQALEAEAARRGIGRIVLHAQETALGFYARLGYQAFGEPYQEEGIPHRSMAKDLARPVN